MKRKHGISESKTDETDDNWAAHMKDKPIKFVVPASSLKAQLSQWTKKDFQFRPTYFGHLNKFACKQDVAIEKFNKDKSHDKWGAYERFGDAWLEFFKRESPNEKLFSYFFLKIDNFVAMLGVDIKGHRELLASPDGAQIQVVLALWCQLFADTAADPLLSYEHFPNRKPFEQLSEAMLFMQKGQFFLALKTIFSAIDVLVPSDWKNYENVVRVKKLFKYLFSF